MLKREEVSLTKKKDWKQWMKCYNNIQWCIYKSTYKIIKFNYSTFPQHECRKNILITIQEYRIHTFFSYQTVFFCWMSFFLCISISKDDDEFWDDVLMQILVQMVELKYFILYQIWWTCDLSSLRKAEYITQYITKLKEQFIQFRK